MFLTGVLALGTACALGTGCAFDAVGADPGSGDDAPDVADAPVADPSDAGFAPDSAPALPDAALPEKGSLRCARTTVAPALDGTMGEWAAVPVESFAMASAAQLVDQTAGYVASMSVTFQCLHDAQNLYFAIRVQDDNLLVNSMQLYDDDAVHLYLDARGDATGAFGADDHELVIRSDAMYRDYGPVAIVSLFGSIVSYAASTDDFDIEIGIAKSSLGADSPLPARLGFDLGISDDDGLGAFSYGLWHLADRPVCTSCCTDWPGVRAWCDTTTFGTLILE